MYRKTLILAAFAGFLAPPGHSLEAEPASWQPLRLGTLSVVQGTALAPHLMPETILCTPVPTKRLKQRKVVVTAYSSTPDQTDDSPFITAIGTTVRDGIVAANWLPIGAYIRLPEIYGEKVFVVEDRMHPKNSHKVDVWMPTRDEAKEFGVRRVMVEVL